MSWTLLLTITPVGPSWEALPWAYCVGLLDINHMVVGKGGDASIYCLLFYFPKGISERDEVEHYGTIFSFLGIREF